MGQSGPAQIPEQDQSVVSGMGRSIVKMNEVTSSDRTVRSAALVDSVEAAQDHLEDLLIDSQRLLDELIVH